MVVQGTVQDDYATKQGLNPVRVPDYNGALNQLKAGTADAWIAPAEIGEKSAKDSGGKITVAAKQLSSAPTAFAVAKGNDKLREALNKGLDEVITDGTWTRLQEQYYPGRPIPTDFKPGSGTVAVRAGQGRLRRELSRADGHPETLRETFFDLGRHARGAARDAHGRAAQHPDPGAVLGRAGHPGGLHQEVGCEDGQLLVVVALVDDLIHRVADPISRDGRTQFVQHKDLGLINEDHIAAPMFARLDCRSPESVSVASQTHKTIREHPSPLVL